MLLVTIIGLATEMLAMAGDDAASLAHRGVDDLLQHFWTGDETTGHIVDTWHG